MERAKRKAAVKANENLTSANKVTSSSKKARKDDQPLQGDETLDLNNNESLTPEKVNTFVNPPTSPTQQQENPLTDSIEAQQSSNEQLDSVHVNYKIINIWWFIPFHVL